ncbi:YdhK family protein [Bacillus solitudinis]|uniref:YdhK family protein n=1 Tax=Bacillus solitudinis TaxID=2014074 RepID=UPI000C24C6F2|nr:YdhK family protein [Bacillus solitudinis]
MLNKKLIMGIVSLLLLLMVLACGDNLNTDSNTEENVEIDDDSNMEHGDMDHSSSGEVPEDLKTAEDPTFEVGSQAIIQTGHMEGMQGAEATIVGAYDTTAYAVSYTPTTGGERVENHKWVIHEEIVDAGENKLDPGTEVILEADHMQGMEGATAEIVSVEETTVYMIDFTPTTGGEAVENHKWVTESELALN